MTKMRVSLRGYYGGRNVGDDALLYVILRELDRLYPGATVQVAPGIHSAVPETSLDVTAAPRSQLRGCLEIIRSDLLLYGGGGILQDYHADAPILRRHLWTARLARLGRTPAVYLGVSVGPLAGRKAAARLRAITATARLITVRDRESLRQLEAIGAKGDIHLAQDLSLLLLGQNWEPAARCQPERPVLGVSTNPFFYATNQGRPRDESILATMARALNQVMAATEQLTVKLLCFHRGADQDLWAAQYLRARLRAPERTTIFPYCSDPRRALAEIAACDHLLSYRLHAAILAYLARVPMLMLSYHPKTDGFAEMIRLPPVAVLPVTNLSVKALADGLFALLQGDLPGPQVPVAESVRAAQRNFELLREALPA